ncbi:hypothetical protein [Pseudoxanthomonas koreensis]|nr:hypothetical protein [Pseudoxanthomonas koreensis]
MLSDATSARLMRAHIECATGDPIRRASSWPYVAVLLVCAGVVLGMAI